MSELPDRHAAVIGIDAYGHGIASLKSAVADARAIARVLESGHGYNAPAVLLDSAATGAQILRLLEETLPQRVGADSALVLYFAGHGIACGDGSEGPGGFLLPYDAEAADESTWLAMDRIHEVLGKLPCRHLLVVLDCCFAGIFRWASTRNFVPIGRPLYDSELNRYLLGTAWQVLTSASHDEKALDMRPGAHNRRGEAEAEGHSPFAAALLRGLAGEADSARGCHDADGVITATELHQYVFEELVPPGSQSRQTPGLWPLKPENTGEFVFLSPRQEKKTRPDPPLDDANNPWLGLQTYDEGDAPLFFGRERVVKDLLDRLLDDSQPPLLAVVGASGTGKSSVVKAGVLPRLKKPPEELSDAAGTWFVVRAPRLRSEPRTQLAEAERRLAEAPEGHRKLLFIDQLEELFTQCPDAAAQGHFMDRLRELASGADPVRVLFTLRSDFEPQWLASEALGDLPARGRYLVPALKLEELRELIEEPAKTKALFFEPPELVDKLIAEMMATPGALPLLSFALAEMYRHARRRRRATGAPDRALTQQDYEAVGGVVGALHRRASELIEVAEVRGSLATVRRVALRMVSLEGGRVTRRRISRRELEYAPREEQEQVERVVRRLTEARLVVVDQEYLEPAHDTLVQAWSQMTAWLAKAAKDQHSLRAVWLAAEAWDKGGRADGLLWNEDPRLPQVEAMRGELNRLEGEFVAASVGRKRKRRLAFTGITAAVVMLLAWAAVYSFSKRAEAEAALAEARNQRLAAEARSYPHGRLDLALLLTLELQRRGEVFEARRLLFEGLESSPRLERLLHGHSEVRAVAWSSDGRLASGGAGSSVRLWDATGRPGPPLAGHDGGVWSLAWSDGRLAVGGQDGLRLWDVDALYSEPRRLGAEVAIYAVAWSGDGGTLAAAQDDHSVRLWDVESGGAAGPVLTGATGWLTSVVWSTDGRTVAAAGMDKRIRRWDAATGEQIGLPLEGHAEGVTSLAWSSNGEVLASGSLDGTVVLWNPATGQVLGRLDSLVGPVGSVAWRGKGSTLAVGGVDGRVVLWDMTLEHARARSLTGQIAALRSLAWSNDGRTLASGNGSAVVLWNTGDGPRLGHRIELAAAEVRCVAASRDGAILAAEGRDPISRELTLRLWDAASGEPLGVPVTNLLRRTAALAWSTDGRSLAAAGLDRTVRRWEIATGNVLGEVRLDGDGRLSSLAWSADGTRLAAGSSDGSVGVWDAAAGESLGSLREKHAGRVTRLAWSADARALASAGKDGTLRLWDVASGRQDGEPLQSNAAIASLAWSGDGRTLAAAGQDGRIRLWDVERREPFAELTGGHGDTISGLVFSGDGATLLSICVDGVLMRWDIEAASWRRRACSIANRNLTPEEWRRFFPGSRYRRTCEALSVPFVEDSIQESSS